MDLEARKLIEAFEAGKVSRRDFMRLTALIGVGFGSLSALLAACGNLTPTTAPASATTAAAGAATTAASAATTAASAATTAAGSAATTAAASGTGATLPADAAPADQQVFVMHYDNTADFTTIDFFESVYKRGGAVADLLSDPLVRLDKNFKIQPGAATKWEVDSTGLVWTFHLDPNLMWSDDTPVTADDYVATFRYGADPKHAWDFTWFFHGMIKNWDDAVAGKVPARSARRQSRRRAHAADHHPGPRRPTCRR